MITYGNESLIKSDSPFGISSAFHIRKWPLPQSADLPCTIDDDEVARRLSQGGYSLVAAQVCTAGEDRALALGDAGGASECMLHMYILNAYMSTRRLHACLPEYM